MKNDPRIDRDKKHEEIITLLTKGDDPVFTDIWRVLAFAAFLGLKNGKRSPINDVESNKSFFKSYIRPSCGEGYIYFIGILDKKDSSILRSTDTNNKELITAFCEYANGGLEMIQTAIDGTSSPLDAILQIISAERDESMAQL